MPTAPPTLVAPTERQRFEDAVLSLKGRLQHRRREDILCLFLSSSTLTRSIVSTQLSHLSWRVDDASRLVDATHTVRQRLAFVMRSATDPMLREAAKYVLGGNVTSPNVRNETESSEIKDPLHTGQPNTQQPGQATSTLLRKKLPAQDYSQLVLVDALVHENYSEVASQFREIEHEVGGTLILVLLTEPRPAEGLGMRLLPELNISVEEGYRAGYDLVLPKHFDHTVALFLTELFLSASGRWQKLTSQAAASGMANYNRIRYVLGDVADWKTPPLKGEAPSPNNTSAFIPKGGGALLSSSTQSMTTKNDIATSLKAPSVGSPPLTRAQHQELLLLSQIQKQKEQIKLLIRFIHTNYLSSQQQQQQQAPNSTNGALKNSTSPKMTVAKGSDDSNLSLAEGDLAKRVTSFVANNESMKENTSDAASALSLASNNPTPITPSAGIAGSASMVPVKSLSATALSHAPTTNISAASPTATTSYHQLTLDELLRQVKADEDADIQRKQQEEHRLDCVDTNPEFVKLMARYEASLSTLQRLQEKHKLLSESRLYLQGQFDQTTSDLVNVKAQLEQANALIAQLQGSSNKDKSAIQAELEAAKSNRVHDAGTIAALNKQIAKLRQRVTDSQGEIESLTLTNKDQALQIAQLAEALEDARATCAKGVKGTRAALEATNNSQMDHIQSLTELLLDSRDTFNGLPGAIRKRKEADPLSSLLNGELASLLLGKLRTGPSSVALQQMRKAQIAKHRALRAEEKCERLETALMAAQDHNDDDKDDEAAKGKGSSGSKLDALSESQFNEIMSHVREGRVSKVSKLLYLRGDKLDKFTSVKESDFCSSSPMAAGTSTNVGHNPAQSVLHPDDGNNDLIGSSGGSVERGTTISVVNQKTQTDEIKPIVVDKYLTDAQLMEMYKAIRLSSSGAQVGEVSEESEEETLQRLRNIQFGILQSEDDGEEEGSGPVVAPIPPSAVPAKKGFQRLRPEDIRRAEEAKYLSAFNGLQPHALPAAISSPYFRLKK